VTDDFAFTTWPLFPFEGEFRVKALGPPLEAELLREGEGDRPCSKCADLDAGLLWSNERWIVSAGPRRAWPVAVFLETRAHVDLDDLDDDLAAELGVLLVRVEAAVRAVPDVGRVHVHRWSDGSAHLHFWLIARPARRIEMYGWGNVMWSEVLPPVDEAVFERNLGVVRRELERTAGG
jgi:diadenosine tetraphosphate (Ap4A) HIT family hydrolase